MRQPTEHYREMQNELTRLRNELSFAFGDSFHGGSHHEWAIAELREHIRDQMAEMEKVERAGGRYE